MVTYKGKRYRSKKHPVLEHIFLQYNPDKDITLISIPFKLRDISLGYQACNIPEPASISNTILDLTRQNRTIASRLPESIYSLGYDLRKKTGPTGDGQNYAGEFIYVGIGNEIQSWLEWPHEIETRTISSTPIPPGIRPFVRRDEGALFSVIDYCDVLSQVLYNGTNVILRVQHPVKWQPNEIDGLYFANLHGESMLFPIEAKALTTGDDVNLEQLNGAFEVFSTRYASYNASIIPLAIQMVNNGMKIAVFRDTKELNENTLLEMSRAIHVTFDPPIESWR